MYTQRLRSMDLPLSYTPIWDSYTKSSSFKLTCNFPDDITGLAHAGSRSVK